MKVKAAFALCECTGLGEALVPATFERGDDDNLSVLDENVTDENVDDIERAVASCPRSAISILDD